MSARGAAAATGLLGALLLVTARVFDAAALYVPGVALVALALVLPAWTALAARGARVRRTLGARRVEEGEPLPVRLDVRRGRVRAGATTVEDPLLTAGAGRGPGPEHFTATFARRGRRRLAPPTLVLSDPLGLSRRALSGADGEDEVLVLPRISDVVAGAGDGAERAGPAGALTAALAAVEVDGLRPYREGTPAARIHWPSVARGNGLVERRLRPEADARPLVVLDARRPGAPERLDAAVRAAASLTLALARRGGCALLLPGERRAATIEPDLGAWAAAHARLALVEEDARSMAPVIGAGLRGALVYVSAAPRAALPRPVHAVARGRRLLVVPAAAAGPAPLFSVAGCAGFELARGRSRIPAPGGA